MEVGNGELDDFRHKWREELHVEHGELYQTRGASVTTTSTMRNMAWGPSPADTSEGFSSTRGPSRDASVATIATMRAHTSRSSMAATSLRFSSTAGPSDSESPFFVNIDTDHDMDADLEESEDCEEDNEVVFTVATDFGTTFSSVVFTKRENGRQGQIYEVEHYPEDPMPFSRWSKEVPTETWYPNLASSIEHADGGNDGLGNDEPFYDPFAIDDSIQSEDDEDAANTMNIEGAVEVNDVGNPMLWGFECQSRMLLSPIQRKRYTRIARSKLILDTTSQKTQSVRDELRPILTQLKRRRVIKNDEDIISGYLIKLFTHTKDFLTQHHGLNDSCSIEHVLSVPNIWKSKACRTMQNCMATAIRTTNFGTMDNLFIVSEPEAAAAYVLEDGDEINPGETFVIIDAGGGTVDTTTYTVEKNYPLRLKTEAVEPSGGPFGSSYLNENFKKHIKERLKNEHYLEVGGHTIDSIVEAMVVRFENSTKRILNMRRGRPLPPMLIGIPGLRENAEKRFSEDQIQLQYKDWLEIYLPLLEGISNLMKTQLQSARIVNLQVEKVVLVGGFAGSPTLQEYLRLQLEKFSTPLGYPVQLITANDAPETAVAHGAVIRALDKRDGPSRVTLSSYGFLFHDPYDKDGCPAHEGIRPTIDPVDGLRYVRDTIRWLVRRGEEVLSHKEYKLEVEHTFASNKAKLICVDKLYVSDTSIEDHYRKNHLKNADAEEVGRIEADMTFLKTDGIIDVEIPDKSKGEPGKPLYRVKFELVIIVDGRNLRYEARYPVGGGVQSAGQISIAAAFVPGTD